MSDELGVAEMPCECYIRHPDQFDEGTVPCGEEGPVGLSCTRPDGHDGPHTACGESHPSHAWLDD